MTWLIGVLMVALALCNLAWESTLMNTVLNILNTGMSMLVLAALKDHEYYRHIGYKNVTPIRRNDQDFSGAS